MRFKLLLAGVIAAVTTAPAARAQFTQYADIGRPSEDEESMKERLTMAMDQARWRIGPIRVEPWIGLGKMTYYKDLFPQRDGDQADFTVSAGAGFTAFMPVGSRLLLAGYALPEFRWWQEYNKRNRWNGKYGLGAFADLGRLRLDLRTFMASEPWYVGYDNEVPIGVQREGAALNAEVAMFGRFSLFGSGEETYWRYRDEDLDDPNSPRLTTLDRDQRRVGGGVLYRFGDRLTVMLGREKSETDFLLSTFDRSNTGTAPMVGVDFVGGRLQASLRASRYEIKPKDGSLFVPFDGRTGRARLDWKFSEMTRLSLYSSEGLAFQFGGTDYYKVTRVGSAFQFPVGYRISASVFGETGTHDYVSLSRPAEDVRSYGATASFRFRQRGGLNLRWERATYDAEGTEQNRTSSRFHFGVDFGFGSAVVW